MTTEIYESPVDVLNGLWKPFGKNVSRFLSSVGEGALPVVGRMGADEARQVYDSVFQQFGEEASDIFGSPNANILEDGLGVWIAWKDDATLNRAVEIASDYGISLDPDSPNIIEPLGLRNSDTPYEVPGVDVSKYSGTRGSRLNTGVGAIGDMFDSTMGAMFYDRNWTPENAKHPSEMYMNLLDASVDASSPHFIDWFDSVMDMWMGESSDMRQQFFHDLLKSNPDAWGDWIHECIYPPGERPSDITEIEEEIEDPPRDWPEGGPLPTVEGSTEEQPREWPEGGPLPTVEPTPPRGGHTRPVEPEREGSPETEPDWALPQFTYRRQHPLDPEAWEKRGLGFLTMFTPAAVEEWLMDHYNGWRRKERQDLGVHTQWDPEEGWDAYWDNKWTAQERRWDERAADKRRNS